ncbi:lasso peptide biosynthesis B2 protein [Paenibacillus plantiphilus]|nr:lasso peptide biosynthesis B2 protein [Paenibacillus plantiphilus]
MMLLIIEAFLYLGWARILKARPFAKVAPGLGVQMEETPLSRDRANEQLLLRISKALHMVSRHTWWESKCMVMAMAGMKMLERRRIESTLYMGTGKDDNGRMIAHAWLRSGIIYLTGADEIPKYTVVAKFRKTIVNNENQRSTSNG